MEDIGPRWTQLSINNAISYVTACLGGMTNTRPNCRRWLESLQVRRNELLAAKPDKPPYITQDNIDNAQQLLRLL